MKKIKQSIAVVFPMSVGDAAWLSIFDKKANAIKSSGNTPIISGMYKHTRENNVSMCVCSLFITAKHFHKMIYDNIFSQLYTFSEESMLTFLRISLDSHICFVPKEAFGNDDVSDYI